MAFIERMEKKHNYNGDELRQMFAEATYKQRIIDAITHPAEKRLKWWEYRNIFLKEKRINKGVLFWRENENILKAVSEAYQVDPHVVVAIIGVETRYGSIIGSYRLVDSLSTLGFDYPPRSKFFLSELEQFLLLAREEKKDPLSFKGSYAGAMGYGQFIPSSYRNYAVDFDEDGLRDIWSNVADALGSVANYLRRHGWQAQAPVVHPVRVKNDDALETKINQGLRQQGLAEGATLPYFKSRGVDISDIPFDRKRRLGLIRLAEKEGPAYWLAENNFYVITTYNISRLYAMAVHELSKSILHAYCQQTGQAQSLSVCAS